MRGNYLPPWSGATANTQLFAPPPYHLACIIPFLSSLCVVWSVLGAAQTFKPTSHVRVPPLTHRTQLRTHFDSLALVVVNGASRVAGRDKYAAKGGGGGVTWRLKKKRGRSGVV